MRRFAFIALLIPLLCGQSPMQAFPPGAFQSGSAPAAVVSLAIDGAVRANTSLASNPVSLTTTAAPGVIAVEIISNSTTVVSVLAAGLTFTARPSSPVCESVTNCCFAYTAPYSSNFSGIITVLMGSAAFTSVTAFGISGAKTSSYFDANVSLPANANTNTTYAAMTTSNANDFIYTNALSAAASTAQSAGWQSVIGSTGANFQLVQYKIVSATQSGLTPAGIPHCSIGDAIVQGP